MVRKDFGFPPLVTPVSQIIGAQSLQNVTENNRYKSLTTESKKLLLGGYGRLPGKTNEELQKKASQEGLEEEPKEQIVNMKRELKKLCKENDLPDLSDDLESLLTYILFPNIAIQFLKTRNFE